MLPTLVNEPFDSSDHIFEVKWGGVRAIAEVDGHDVRVHGRNLRNLTPLYPELARMARCFDATQAIVDGEIIAWDAENLPSFDLLRPRLLRPNTKVASPRRSPITYQVFDMLALDGASLLERPLFERRNLLHERLSPDAPVQVADFVDTDGVAFFEAVAAQRLEGIVAKDRRSLYRPGETSDAWQEVRTMQADDFVVGGYSFGGSPRKEPIESILLGAYRDGRLCYAGQVSVGCSQRESELLLDLLTPLHATACPFDGTPDVSRLLYWCRPELACRVRYAEWARNGLLRFPVFVAPRPDIPPEACTVDEA